MRTCRTSRPGGAARDACAVSYSSRSWTRSPGEIDLCRRSKADTSSPRVVLTPVSWTRSTSAFSRSEIGLGSLIMKRWGSAQPAVWTAVCSMSRSNPAASTGARSKTKQPMTSCRITRRRLRPAMKTSFPRIVVSDCGRVCVVGHGGHNGIGVVGEMRRGGAIRPMV